MNREGSQPGPSHSPDVVYVVKAQARSGTATNELRYSLRTLANLSHGRVWIVGWKPEWVRNVEYIPTVQRLSKFVNALKNLEAVLPHVSEEFVLMNDDFYILTPQDRIPVLYRESWDVTSAVKQAKTSVLRFLERHGVTDPVSYELHVPFVYNRDLLVETLAKAHGVHIAGYQRTLYGNLNRIGGVSVPDPKVKGNQPFDGWPFVSTSDNTFKGGVGQMIRQLFPEPSPFECV